MIHWRDAQRYKETHGSIDGYMDAVRKEAVKQLEQLEKRGYDIYSISLYASKSLSNNKPDEAWTEYRVKQILGGR